MALVAPTVKDVARAVAQLNENQDEESLERVARNMAYHLGRSGVVLRKVSQRDASLLLSVTGGDDFILASYARALAGRIRAYSNEYGRMVPFI